MASSARALDAHAPTKALVDVDSNHSVAGEPPSTVRHAASRKLGAAPPPAPLGPTVSAAGGGGGGGGGASGGGGGGGSGGGRRPLRTSLVRTSFVRDVLLTRRETNTQAHFEATQQPDYEANAHSCIEQVLDFLSVGTGGRLVCSRRYLYYSQLLIIA